MISFIKSVLVDLKGENLNFEDLEFILPNKRAGIFLKHQLAELIDKPIFSPKIKGIEEFVEDLSGLTVISNIELVFKLYNAYVEIMPNSECEPFDSFTKWAQILLQDFNEIDRHLVKQHHIFEYLNAINEINHWSKPNNQTELISEHLKFWNSLSKLYDKFTDNLLQNKSAYQGLAYREACENIEIYIENNLDKTLVFLGFNALNKAESNIIQALLQSDIAHVYWDIDETFVKNPIHDAGHFIRTHKTTWNYFKKNPFNWLHNHYQQEKSINVVGVPKFIGQAKYIGQILRELNLNKESLSQTAVVLGEESLLLPVLNSLPKEIDKLNVTMGLNLKYVPLASAFEALFKIHKSQSGAYYYQDVVKVLTHPSFYCLFDADETNNSVEKIVTTIQTNNLTYLNLDKLKSISGPHTHLIKLLFGDWKDSPNIALERCIELILEIKHSLNKQKKTKALELEYLHRFYAIFNQLIRFNTDYNHLSSIQAIYQVYKELLASESLDFKGEPLEGLQLMGMLESRVLDFETVIISSVNEGILPAGKSNNSFIPFDVKIENGLPTFKEKDAVYTYHFYHLLQRAKHVYILYNTENDALNGGEKSRFITQLEVEGIHKINEVLAVPNIPLFTKPLLEIPKTKMVMDKISEVSLNGFSPSSLTNYIRNPIDFYYQKILGIKEYDDVEEHIAFNTLGSVIHNTLEDFYRPVEGKFLMIDYLKSLIPNIEDSVAKHFQKLYKEGDFTKGKNLIIFNIVQHYIKLFLESEIKSLEDGNSIKVIAVETDTNCAIEINGINFPINIKGKVDRIDEFNGTRRIIDYKSGKVDQGKVEIVDWDSITTDYDKFSKSFQVLCYVYMMHKQNAIELPVEAGIISFKNLSKGLLKFGVKSSARARTKDQLITKDTLDNFEIELKKLILEICNPDINFIEKELE